MVRDFTLKSFPDLVFGEGKLYELPVLMKARKIRFAALLTGGHSFRAGDFHKKLLEDFDAAGIKVREFSVP